MVASLTEEKVRRLCPQIKNDIVGKTSSQVKEYELILSEELMPDNSREAMTTIHKEIEKCSSIRNR